MIVKPNITRHPKFTALKRAVGERALEYLVNLWGFCEDQRTAKIGPVEWVEDLAGWAGTPGLLRTAVETLEWIDVQDGTAFAHEWEAYNGKLNGVQQSAAANARWAQERAKKPVEHSEKTAPKNGGPDVKKQSVSSPVASPDTPHNARIVRADAYGMEGGKEGRKEGVRAQPANTSVPGPENGHGDSSGETFSDVPQSPPETGTCISGNPNFGEKKEARSTADGGTNRDPLPDQDTPPEPGSRAAIEKTAAQLCSLFGRGAAGMSAMGMHALQSIADSLPIAPEDWRRLQAWYAAAPLHPEPEDKLLRYRMRNPSNLAQKLTDALVGASQWSEIATKKTARSSSGKKPAPTDNTAPPDGWEAAYETKFGEPPGELEWASIPPTVQIEIMEVRK